MSNIRTELVNIAINRAYRLTDLNTHNDKHKRYEFRKQTILYDHFLTEVEKTEAIKLLNKSFDKAKIDQNEGTKRICENCNQECFATLYCEFCVRNYLIANFSNWTSGNDNIDDLIRKCQMETSMPSKIVEWIPYDNFKNIQYLTKGGFSDIYKAGWTDGGYEEWDPKKQRLIRFGTHRTVLKELKNVESANQSWFEEARSYLTKGNKHSNIIRCYGITQNPSNGNYILVIRMMDLDLRNYLQQNHNQLMWRKRIIIIMDIIVALLKIHKENAIHKDLHSRNILYSQFQRRFFISDFGLCGPANRSSKSIYGNLPYIAPEVIVGKEPTFASDIYSVAMLMWEISSGKPPFNSHEHDNNLAMNIVNGIRPKIVPGTPLKYKILMEQCWDADPLKRPNIKKLWKKINEINRTYQNTPNELASDLEINRTNYTSGTLTTSKVYQFENFPEPKNATEEEQEAFHRKSYESSIQTIETIETIQTVETIEDDDAKNLKVVNEPQINSRVNLRTDVQFVPKDYTRDDYIREETIQQIQQHIKNLRFDTGDDDEHLYNDPNFHPNFHSEEEEHDFPDEQEEQDFPDDTE